MELYEVMRTTFAVREFSDDPLPDPVLYRILDHARFAASGGNRQGWKVIVVRERPVREELVQLMTGPIKRYVAQVEAGENPWNSVTPSTVDAARIEATDVPDTLVRPILSAPVLLLVCVDLSVVASVDQDLERVGVASGASIYPFAWNVLLAARSEGFGGVLTTFAAAAEPRVHALFDIPEHVALAAVIPLGRPVKQLSRLRRRPVEEFTFREQWGGAVFLP